MQHYHYQPRSVNIPQNFPQGPLATYCVTITEGKSSDISGTLGTEMVLDINWSPNATVICLSKWDLLVSGDKEVAFSINPILTESLSGLEGLLMPTFSPVSQTYSPNRLAQ